MHISSQIGPSPQMEMLKYEKTQRLRRCTSEIAIPTFSNPRSF